MAIRLRIEFSGTLRKWVANASLYDGEGRRKHSVGGVGGRGNTPAEAIQDCIERIQTTRPSFPRLQKRVKEIEDRFSGLLKEVRFVPAETELEEGQ